jgi:diguanylate cyclase (GGDEF)-like protein
VVAVLVACYARVEPIEPEDLEALRIVASHAGAAIGALRRLEAAQALSDRRAVESRTDALTGVTNRRGAQERLAQLRPGDSVALLDIDHFKAINDERGHAAGDRILQELAAFLASSIRSGDRVARFGGEEFVLILPQTSAAGAARVVDRLRRTWHTKNPTVTFSAGTAETAATDFPATTLGRADAALYEAKTAGRNRVVASFRTELEPAH